MESKEKQAHSDNEQNTESTNGKEPYEPLEIEVINFQYEDIISCD